MSIRIPALCVIAALFAHAVAAEDKAIWHYVSLPIIEGTGLFASISSLADNRSSPHTMVAAGTNIGLLAAQGTIGLLSAIGAGDSSPKLRLVHRILGFVVTGAALWLGIANSIDHGDPAQQITSYSYAALSTIPIIMFSF